MPTAMYKVVRSRRKTVCLEITRDLTVLVRAPLGMPGGDIDRFVLAHRRWIDAHMEKRRQYRLCHPEPTAQELHRLKARAREYIPGRVELYSAIMGVAPTGIKITSAKRRFGSCNAANGLCFSALLMAYPMEAIDYVVVHELAHITHKNHGKAFYALIESVLPDYASRRRQLKKGVVYDA